MAIGLDTSVVLRLLIGEPRARMGVARRRIESALIVGEQVVVTDLVVAEAFHALRHHYGVSETMALGRLRKFLGSGLAHVDPAGAREALGRDQGGRQVSWIGSSSLAIVPSERSRQPSITGRRVWREGCYCASDDGVRIVTNRLGP